MVSNHINSFKPIIWIFEFELWLCVTLCNANWTSYAKNLRKSVFQYFSYYNFSSISNFILKFLRFFAMLMRSFVRKKKRRNYIQEILIYANFSYICAPKPVGCIDPSRFERVKAWCIIAGSLMEVWSYGLRNLLSLLKSL